MVHLFADPLIRSSCDQRKSVFAKGAADGKNEDMWHMVSHRFSVKRPEKGLHSSSSSTSIEG